MPTVNVYSAARYVIGIHTPLSSRKLFQIGFSTDGSLFVIFPYYRSGSGRLGLVHLDETLRYPTSLTIGENFPATSHYVKYAHHVSGRAHFSLSGKISSSIGKQAVPLAEADGHVFTVMLQGLEYFDPISSKDRGTEKRGVVLFPFEQKPLEAVKFLGMIYSEKVVARMFNHRHESPWMRIVLPDGSGRPGLLLTTPLMKDGQKYFLLLSAERMNTICTSQETYISLMGGFDVPNVAWNLDVQTSFLMFIYPSTADLGDLVRQFGTVDIQPTDSVKIEHPT